MYENEFYGLLPGRKGNGIHYPPASWLGRWKEQARYLDGMVNIGVSEYAVGHGEAGYSAFGVELPLGATFPIGTTVPWSVKCPVMHGPKRRVVAYLWLTIDVTVWQTQDKSRQPVVYRLPGGASIELLDNVERDIPNIRTLLETITAQAELSAWHLWLDAERS